VPQLVQANGQRLPFRDASFDAVMMMQVLGAAPYWSPLASEALRVLRSPGTLVIGNSVTPTGGVDAKMKRRLALLLGEMGAPSYHNDARDEVIGLLNSIAATSSRVVAADWESVRTPKAFLDRQPSGAQFAGLPTRIKDEALLKLRVWAAATFGSLDAAFTEKYMFELRIFEFQNDGGRKKCWKKQTAVC
jgi:SAM-dependent methyltransferase